MAHLSAAGPIGAARGLLPQEYLKQCIELLNHLCMLVRTDLSKLMRAKLVALITIDVRLPASLPPFLPAPERALQSSFDGVAPLKNASRAMAFG